jgi:hypothetical protein
MVEIDFWRQLRSGGCPDTNLAGRVTTEPADSKNPSLVPVSTPIWRFAHLSAQRSDRANSKVLRYGPATE